MGVWAQWCRGTNVAPIVSSSRTEAAGRIGDLGKAPAASIGLYSARKNIDSSPSSSILGFQAGGGGGKLWQRPCLQSTPTLVSDPSSFSCPVRPPAPFTSVTDLPSCCMPTCSSRCWPPNGGKCLEAWWTGCQHNIGLPLQWKESACFQVTTLFVFQNNQKKTS